MKVNELFKKKEKIEKEVTEYVTLGCESYDTVKVDKEEKSFPFEYDNYNDIPEIKTEMENYKKAKISFIDTSDTFLNSIVPNILDDKNEYDKKKKEILDVLLTEEEKIKIVDIKHQFQKKRTELMNTLINDTIDGLTEIYRVVANRHNIEINYEQNKKENESE